jgi:hypothetical protein
MLALPAPLISKSVLIIDFCKELIDQYTDKLLQEYFEFAKEKVKNIGYQLKDLDDTTIPMKEVPYWILKETERNLKYKISRGFIPKIIMNLISETVNVKIEEEFVKLKNKLTTLKPKKNSDILSSDYYEPIKKSMKGRNREKS